jgi:hypothetical protein
MRENSAEPQTQLLKLPAALVLSLELKRCQTCDD